MVNTMLQAGLTFELLKREFCRKDISIAGVQSRLKNELKASLLDSFMCHCPKEMDFGFFADCVFDFGLKHFVEELDENGGGSQQQQQPKKDQSLSLWLSDVMRKEQEKEEKQGGDANQDSDDEIQILEVD